MFQDADTDKVKKKEYASGHTMLGSGIISLNFLQIILASSERLRNKKQ